MSTISAPEQLYNSWYTKSQAIAQYLLYSASVYIVDPFKCFKTEVGIALSIISMNGYSNKPESPDRNLHIV